MRYVTAEEMKDIDRQTIESRGITAMDLMENAGRAVAEEVKKVTKTGDVVVFCGYGNNGGDGFVAARHLARSKYSVTAYIVGTDKRFTRETAKNHQALINMGVPVLSISEKDYMKDIFRNIEFPSVVVDAIFGIGLRGGLDSFYADLIGRINDLHSPIVSADIPSGLDSDSGHPLPVAIRASRTVTFGYPKRGFQNSSAKAYLGDVVVADIGLRENPGEISKF